MYRFMSYRTVTNKHSINIPHTSHIAHIIKKTCYNTMEDQLQYIPILTVCVVGILLVIVLGVTVVSKPGRQAWTQHDEETGSVPSTQSHGCCFICCCKRRSNRNKVQPINDETGTKQSTQPNNLQSNVNEQKPPIQLVNSARSEATNSTATSLPAPHRNSKDNRHSNQNKDKPINDDIAANQKQLTQHQSNLQHTVIEQELPTQQESEATNRTATSLPAPHRTARKTDIVIKTKLN